MIDSKHQKLSPQEIISIAAQNTGSPYSPEQVKAALVAEVHKAGAILMQEGNTLFVIHRAANDPQVAVFRALNADTPENYLQNSVRFTKAMKIAKFKSMVTEFQDPSLLNIFKYIGKDQPQGMGYQVQRLEDGSFRVIVNLGPNPHSMGVL